MDTEESDHARHRVSPGLFATTRWSMVHRAQDKSEAALNDLFASYRQPLLAWLRAKGRSPQDAEDLVQGFFAGLMRHDFLKSVGREKGKFRSFLLSSLKHHLSDVRDKEDAAKRGGGQLPASLQETDDLGHPIHDPAAPGTTPDQDYDRAWAQAVLSKSLRQLETECSRTGHGALCAALEPVMFADETAAPYHKIGEDLGMSEGAVKVAAHRIRARLRGIIREEILQTVDNEGDLQDELHYLFSLFGK